MFSTNPSISPTGLKSLNVVNGIGLGRTGSDWGERGRTRGNGIGLEREQGRTGREWGRTGREWGRTGREWGRTGRVGMGGLASYGGMDEGMEQS